MKPIIWKILILIFHQIVESFTGLIAPYCVVVLAGRQPACVLRLVWHNNPSQIFSTL